MWDILEVKLFRLLSESYSENGIEYQFKDAYKEFVERLIYYLDSETDNMKRIRTLNLIHIESETVKSLELSYGDKKNILKIVYSDKVSSFIQKELDLIHRQMEYPKYFIKIETSWQSPLFLNPNIINYVDIMENICGYYYLGGVTSAEGKNISFSQLVNGFELLFNLKFADVYKKREEVIKRKPNKLTGFMERMKSVIIKESREQGYQL